MYRISHAFSRVLPLLALGILSVLPAQAERKALVIGNGRYDNAVHLPNALNDADDMAVGLQAGGWDVTVAKNLSVRDMLKALRVFREGAVGAEACLFYYAGHGVEVKGRNYLLPVDAELSDEAGEDALPIETIALDKMLSDFGEDNLGLKIVVLDCCRDNPLSRSWLRGRSTGGGLAAVDESSLAEGTMLVFSTAPGRQAADGLGRNSPFAEALLQRMKQGGGAVEIFSDVSDQMGAGQEAWIRFDGSGRSLSAFHKYVMMPLAGLAIVSTEAPAAPAPAITSSVPTPSPAPTPAAPLIQQVELPQEPYSLSELFAGTGYASYNAYSKGQILRQAQGVLKAAGYYSGAIDGDHGRGGHQALLQYQEAQGLAQSARLDTPTLTKMGLMGIVETSPPPSRPRRTSAESGSGSSSSASSGGGSSDAERRAAERVLQRLHNMPVSN